MSLEEFEKKNNINNHKTSCPKKEKDDKHKEKKEKPKLKSKKSNDKGCDKVKCPTFPLCANGNVNTPVRIFGTSVVTSLPLSLNFLTLLSSDISSVLGVAVQNSCAEPTLTITLNNPVSLGLPGNVSFNFSTQNGVCTIQQTNPPNAGLVSNVNISGIPLLGVALGTDDPILSSCVNTSNVNVQPVCKDVATVSGLIEQTLNFTGIATPIPLSTLQAIAESILTAIFTNAPIACLQAIIDDLKIGAGPDLSNFLNTLALLGGGTGTSTLLEVLQGLIPLLISTVATSLATLLATSGASVPVTLEIDNVEFKTIISDCALSKIKKCDPVCATAKATFDGTTPLSVSLTNEELTAPITLTVSTSCIPIDPTANTFLVSTSAFLAAAGIIGTNVLPAIGSVSLTPGGSCIPYSPAVTVRDNTTSCINYGDDCFCGPNIITPKNVDGFAFNSNSKKLNGSCNKCR